MKKNVSIIMLTDLNFRKSWIVTHHVEVLIYSTVKIKQKGIVLGWKQSLKNNKLFAYSYDTKECTLVSVDQGVDTQNGNR